MNDGGGETQQITQKSDPWEGVQPHLKRLYGEAEGLLESPFPQYYPGNTVVPFAPETEEALGRRTDIARMGTPATTAAQQENIKTLGGGYLSPESNPYLSSFYDAAAGRVKENVGSTFEMYNRYGSGAHEETLGRNLSDLAASIYGPAYESERNRMGQAGYLAPGLDAGQYQSPDQLAQVGAQREDLYGGYLSEDINRWNFEQNRPQAKLASYGRFLAGAPGGTMTQSQPIYRNRFAGAVGGAASGAGLSLAASQLFPALSGNPLLGLPIGLGALSGLF